MGAIGGIGLMGPIGLISLMGLIMDYELCHRFSHRFSACAARIVN